MKYSLKGRFDKKYTKDIATGCWIWTAAACSRGYGFINDNGEIRRSHRVSWELHNGPIPEGSGYHGTCVLHKCDTPECVNPDHLFLGTQAENVTDMFGKGRGKKASGERHGRAKLTKKDVLSIRRRYAEGGISHQKIASKYRVSESLVGFIVNRKIWRHV